MAKAWLLNTSPEHWTDCLRGPDSEPHPERHRGHPWHAIPDSRNAPDATELDSGDLLIIRVNGEGVKAVWTFNEAKEVQDQLILPDSWRNLGGERQEYKWLLYCRGEPLRSLADALEENWNDSPDVHQGALAGGAKKAETIIEPYIEFLLESRIQESVKEKLRDASRRVHVSESPQGKSDSTPRRASADPDERANDLKPPKKEYTVSRTIRNTELAREVKELHDYQCQVCGERRRRNGSGYAEAHHIHPLGDDPPGPDIAENVLVLCPNHHADFDFGMIEVDPYTLEITHEYDDRVDGTEIRTTPEHVVAVEYIQYHNQNQ